MAKTLNVSYQALMNEISRLQTATKRAQSGEVEKVVQNIQKKMAEFHLTPKDLDAHSPQRIRHTRRAATPKFKDPATGITWAGRGHTPRWLQEALAQGHAREEYAISR